MKHTPLLLAILDGFAINPNREANAVAQAKTPTFDALLEHSPSTSLVTHGKRVGLPEGQMGNSEVGHLNIGAGRVVKQELTRINEAISEGELSHNEVLKSLCSKLKEQNNGALHLIGLVSNGGVHSQKTHLKALIQEAHTRGIKDIFIHAITDGRDRPQTASLTEVCELNTWLQNEFPGSSSPRIVSLIGRYYAMDRDKRWDRVAQAYKLYFNGEGKSYNSVEDALTTELAECKSDEFLPAINIEKDKPGDRECSIVDGDALLFFNFRTDRMRQMVSCIIDTKSDYFTRSIPSLSGIATLTEYDESFRVPVVFPPNTITNHLGEVLASHGITQLRIAETEKYPHVTYFFSGGSEETLVGEEQMLIPSPRDVATYDQKPEMSAHVLTEKLLARLDKSPAPQVIILNFANCDMVGHTGSLEAAVKAVETVDQCLGVILKKIDSLGGIAFVTADHGNADQMIDYESGKVHTFHTLHPVPFVAVGLTDTKDLRKDGALCDIAPTILKVLGLSQPAEMDGKSLITN